MKEGRCSEVMNAVSCSGNSVAAGTGTRPFRLISVHDGELAREIEKGEVDLNRNFALTFSAICVMANLALGMFFILVLHIPLIFLDNLGTIFGAMLLGPVHGVLIGLLTNVVQGILTNPGNIPFALVKMAIGLFVGLVARNFRFTLPVAVATGLALSVIAPLISTPIAVWIYGDLPGRGADLVFLWLLKSGKSIFTFAFLPRIFGNLVDNVACCMLAALILPKLPAKFLAMGGNPFLKRPGAN